MPIHTSSGTEKDLFLPSSVFTVMSNIVYHKFSVNTKNTTQTKKQTITSIYISQSKSKGKLTR